MRRLTLGVGIVLGGACCSAALAQTQTQTIDSPLPKQNIGVMDQERPYYDAKGIPVGGFRIFPTLDLSGSYDSNIFRQPNDQSDYFLTLAPVLRVQSDWDRHFLEFYTGATNYDYADHHAENLTDWRVGGDGRLDIGSSSILFANGFHGEMHEPLSTPNNLPGLQTQPNRYYQTNFLMLGSYREGDIGLGAGFTFNHLDWLATPTLGGGLISNADRNQDEYQGYGKVSYIFSDNYSAFLRVSYDGRIFDQPVDRFGLDRSSSGFRFDSGVDLQLSELVSGEVIIGYLQQHFSTRGAAQLSNAVGLDYSIQLDWYVQPDLTVHLNGARTLNDVILDHASFDDSKSISVGADYELRHDIILQAKVAYTSSSFPGIVRSDEYPSLELDGEYLVNRYGSITLGYRYTQRATNAPNQDFRDNLLSIGLKTHV